MNIHLKADIHHHEDSNGEIGHVLNLILSNQEKIMASQQELTEQVQKIGETLTKIGKETSTLLTKIEELKTAISNGPAVSPELQAAVDAVTAQAKIVDDLVEDAPEPPPQS